MMTRVLGRTGLKISVLGLGCGAVGGLMVRGDPADRERVVARALEAGINYFDTAPSYGDGQSEENLGQVISRLKPNMLLGTKIRIDPAGMPDIGRAIATEMDSSLRRLGRDHVDLYQLHNPITRDGAGQTLTPRRVLEEIVPAFEKLREQGKALFLGFTAVGDTSSIHELVASSAFDTAQVCYNLLNPSAGAPLAPGDPAQDYGLLLERMRAAGMGAIGIRVLAGGALSGAASRHPIASPPPQPIGSGPDYESDHARAEIFRFLVEEHHAATLAEAAIRFAIGNESIGVTLIGVASVEEFEHAIAAVAKGSLPRAALDRIGGSRKGFA